MGHISIHVPLRGTSYLRSFFPQKELQFQFMCPAGAHHLAKVTLIMTDEFQFMCPCGAHRVRTSTTPFAHDFNSCAPAGHIFFFASKLNTHPFQFMCPCGAHRKEVRNYRADTKFQFMCPCGAHRQGWLRVWLPGQFQFMCPCGAHRNFPFLISRISVISIHVPLRGTSRML